MIATAGGTNTNHVMRTWGTFPATTSDFSYLIYFKTGGAPANYFNLITFFDGNSDYSGAYLYLGSNGATNTIVLEGTNDGIVLHDTSAFTNDTSAHWAGVTYNSANSVLTLIVDGTTIGTTVCDLSAVVFDRCFLLGDGSGTAAGACEVAYLRAWQRLLSHAEFTSEAASITPVSSTNILFSNPFQTSVDLTDHVLTALNYFIGTGTVTTDTTDPLLTVVAGPPTNTDPTTATTVTLDSAFFQDTLTAGVATTTWTKCVCTITNTWAAISFGVLGGTYTPFVVVYEGLANALAGTALNNLGSTANRGVQFPVSAGQTYYFKHLRNGAVTPATLIVSILSLPALSLPQNTFAIPDDTGSVPDATYALIFLDHDQAYPRGQLHGTPAGEGLDVIQSSGLAALTNDNDAGDTLTFVNGTVLGSSVTLPDDGFCRVSSDQNRTFYVASFHHSTLGTAQIITVRNDGVIGPTTWALPVSGMQALGVDADGTIAYWVVNAATNQPIRRFDLTNNVALTDLVAGVVGYAVGKDLIVMSDGSIVALYLKGSPVDIRFKVFSAAGATLVNVSLGSGFDHTADMRLARALEPGHVWVWLHTTSPTTGYDQFLRIRVSDGATIETVPSAATSVQYEAGQAQATASNTPVRVGHSESCGFWVIPVSPATTQTFPIRRQRRFLVPSSDNQYKMQIPTLNVLMRTGIGLTPGPASDPAVVGSDPTVMYRFSKDGGLTWSPERTFSAGKIGEYLRRARITRATGQYRNGVVEITVSDPVDWQFLEAIAEPSLIEGSS